LFGLRKEDVRYEIFKKTRKTPFFWGETNWDHQKEVMHVDTPEGITKFLQMKYEEIIEGHAAIHLGKNLPTDDYINILQ
jgi:hypothetical protein